MLAVSLYCGFLLGLPTPGQTATSQNVDIIINSQPLTIKAGDQPAIILDGRTFVPLRVISENLGVRVKFINETKQVMIITREDQSIPIPSRLGDQKKDVQIVVDGEILNIPTDYGKPFIQENRTLIPLRAVGEALGCGVNWNKDRRLVEITSAPPAPAPDPVVSQPPQVTIPAPSTLLRDLAGYRTNLKLLDGKVINSEELLNQDEASFSPEQLEQFKQSKVQLAKYSQTFKLPDGTLWATADLPIKGKSIATAQQLRDWIADETPRLRAKMEQQYQREFIPIPDLAEFYLRIGAEYGIRGDLAFVQAAKETHYWQFTGDVQPFQNNYCGLWATSVPITGQESYNGADPSVVRFEPGLHGVVFASPEVGVEAHIQHLYAYATRDPLPAGKVLYDPRFSLVNRGSAPTWQKLNARWAVPGITYGQSIIHDYWLNTLKF